MNTKPSSAFGLAMLAVAFSFSSSFACPETSQTTASVVQSVVSESGMSLTPLAEASAPEGPVGEVATPDSVVTTIEAPSTEASAPPAPAFADIPGEITDTVTVVVPGQRSEDEGAAFSGSGITAVEPSVIEEPSETAAPQTEAKAAAELSAQTGTPEVQIEAAEPAPVAVEPPMTGVNVPVSVDAIPVEITETATVVVPGQKSENNDEVLEVTGSEPVHPIAAPSAPSLNREEATAPLDDGE
jgi:hypothetical protein